jgi:hypothetical protein
LISDEIDWHAKTTDPMIKHGGGDSGRLHGGSGNEQDVFGKGIHDAQDVLLFCGRGFERPEQIGVDSSVWFGRLWQIGYCVQG